MKLREFNKILKECSNKKTKLIDKKLIQALDNETKNACINFVVRHRQAVLYDFINLSTDISWLYSMGYLYVKTNKSNYTFLCTTENKIGELIEV